MGMSMGSGEGGFVADINVTPMVDVMLVLLIIFMVVAPMFKAASASRCRSRKTPRLTRR